ncbi:TonB-dependent receptor [Pedobacter sp. JCM 36344]|uniref:TonB-dependent receptor n=1 Tax=Pedobacter sp. JCM 36344 TaxID=3374280 RepID=UPI0039788E66
MKYRLPLLALLTLSLVAVFAFRFEDDPFSVILKKMEIYNKEYQQEKVYLHFDKPYYAVGDDIWFKAYVINVQTSRPSQISGALYVELLNEKDSVKQLLKLPLVSGIGVGDFKLSESFVEGNYRIRAYTQWMRNAGTDFFFDKTIKVGNSWSNKVFTNASYTFEKKNTAQQVNALIKFSDKDGKPYASADLTYDVQLSFRSILKGKATTNAAGEVDLSFLNAQPAIYKSGRITATLTLPDGKKVTKDILIKSTANEVDVQFFPEGGNLVQELPSKAGFKAMNSSGLGEDVTGTIIDNEGQEVNTLESTHLGMGHFVINPQPGKVYSAKIKFKDGSEKSFELPKALPQGYVVSAVNTAENIQLKIMISQGLLNKGELKLVTQHNGNVYFSTRSSSSKPVISTVIKKEDLPSGIIQLTLFDGENKPVCERLVFVNNDADKITTTIKTEKESYSPREKVIVDLSAQFQTKLVQGSFSVAVSNTKSVTPDELNESNIFTTLLLTADLIGYVEKPNYYLNNNNAETRGDVDNLMLTQGWRRIIWNNVINNLSPNIRYQPEKSLVVSGAIATTGGKMIPKTKVSLFSTSGGFLSIDTLTDDNGKFNFDGLSFRDSTKFIVQARTLKGKRNVDFMMNVVSGEIVTKNKNTGDVIVNVNDALSGYLQQSKNYFDELTRRGQLERSITLKEVKIQEKKAKVQNSSNLNGSGGADAVINADQLQTCVTLSQCLQGRVAGLMFRNGIPSLMRNNGAPMQVIVDGMFMEPSFLDNIVPADVETVEILKSIIYTSIYGSRGGGGVLIVTTKRGGNNNYGASKYVEGITTFVPKGYYVSREFYTPKYSPESTDSAPDFRTTIYWNPLIATNENGKAQFSYYCSDEPGIHRIVIEGIDMFGNLSRAVYTYTVK